MLLSIELITLAFFLVCAAHAVASRGREGVWLYGSLIALGFLRENFVALHKLLYEFAPLTLRLGAAPIIGSIIWAYSIYITILWTEEVTDERLGSRPWPSWSFLSMAALFMAALAGFYEPFLKLIGMARWEEGTRTLLDVPLIAPIGYASLTVLFLLAWTWIRRTRFRGGRRLAALAAVLLPIALGHALGLQALKTYLGW